MWRIALCFILEFVLSNYFPEDSIVITGKLWYIAYVKWTAVSGVVV